MTTTIMIEDQLLPDLKLVKRVANCDNYTETIRHILERAGYNKRWLEYMYSLLESESKT